MIIYLTYNDLPSGIFSSQVMDVVTNLTQLSNQKVKLVSFISVRSYFANRNKIKSQLNSAIILPMFPSVKRWNWNKLTFKMLCFIMQPKTIIARSILATQIAFVSKSSKIVYDGRGAISAEWNEYEVINDANLKQAAAMLEKECVDRSFFRIAVSNQLIKYWQTQFNYKSEKHLVIPCTINKVFEELEVSKASIKEIRNELNINENDLVFVYSGSMAGWQSFDLLHGFIKHYLLKENVKLLMLSAMDTNIEKLIKEFPNAIIQKHVSPHLVPKYLLAADYGLLIREQSVTNQVASPVKFAEYLACGLKVIISSDLGDYSDFVLQNNCGHNYTNANDLSSISFNDKVKMRELALKHFQKKMYFNAYSTLLNL